MTTVIVLFVTVSGWASQYSPHVMSEVVRNRTSGEEGIVQLMSDPLYPPLAVADCGRLGQVVRVRYEGHPWEMATVVDCARPGDGTAEWMDRNDILLEMGYQRAAELGTVGRGIRVEMRWLEERTVSLDEPLPGPCLVRE